MQILEPIHVTVAEMVERIASCARGRHRRVVGHPARDRFAPNRARFANRLFAFGGVHDQRDFIVLDHVDHVRPTFAHLVHAPADDARVFESLRRTPGRSDFEAALDEHASERHRGRFVSIPDADEAKSARRQYDARGGLRLCIGFAEGVPGPHDLARGLHFRPEDRIGLGKLDERKHRLFDRKVRRYALHGAPLHCQGLARHYAGRDLGERHAGRLGDERHGARGARIDFEDIDDAASNRELDVHQADDVQRLGEFARLRAQLILDLLRQAGWGQGAARIPGVDPRLLDMLHDAADQHVLPVTDRVDVDLDREVEKAVEQHRTVVRYLDRIDHVLAQIVFVENDFHRAAAEHVAGAHHQRESDVAREQHRLLLGARAGIGRLLELERRYQLLKPLAVFGDIDAVGGGTDDRTARGRDRARELQGSLATELHDHAFRLFLVDDFHDVFERQRFEIEPVGGVVVSRYGLGIAIDHDRLEAVLAQRHGRVHATVVELDTLTYSIRTSS